MSNLDNQAKAPIRSRSEITLSQLWQRYFLERLKKYSSSEKYHYWVLIGKAIEESPAQTLDRSEEIFRFIFDKYGHDTEFITEFDMQICGCLGKALKRKVIDEETDDFIYNCFCDILYPDAKDEANISQQESQSNDENVTEDEMTMKSDLNSQNI